MTFTYRIIKLVCFSTLFFLCSIPAHPPFAVAVHATVVAFSVIVSVIIVIIAVVVVHLAFTGIE